MLTEHSPGHRGQCITSSSKSSSILRVWSGTKRIRCWVRFWHFAVCERKVLSCAVSTSFQTAYRSWVWSCCAAKREREGEREILTVCLLTISLLLIRVVFVLAPFWSQHWFLDDIPCCGSGRNAKHIVLTSRDPALSLFSLSFIPPCLLPPPTNASPCFLTHNNKTFFR